MREPTFIPLILSPGVLGLIGNAGNAISAGRSIAIDPQGRFFFDGWGQTLGTIDSALISPADGTALTGISTVNSANEIPMAMMAESSGRFLYVQQSSTPVVYAINQTTGALAVPPAALAVLSFSPHSAAADPLGPYIYSLQDDGVHAFLIDPQSGNLSEIPGSPFGGTAAQGALAISGTPVQAVSGPVAAIFPSSEDFGPITVGQSSNSKLVTLTNTGGQSLSLSSVGVTGTNPSDFVATPTCSFPTVLAPNVTCTISLVFSPTAAGTRQASLSAIDNAPGSPQSIPLSGTGASPLPAVTLSPGSLTFASTTQGSTSPAQSVTVTSSGGATLHISSVLPGGSNPADFQVTNASSGTGPLHITSVATGGSNASDFSLTNNCTAPTYAVGATCTIGVSLSPLATGARAAFITVTDDAPNSPQTIGLSATVTAALTISPAAPGSTSVTVTAGQTARSNLLLTPGPGFAGSISFACAGAPAAATCTTPNAQLAGGTPLSYVVTVATTANTMITPPPQPPQLPPFVWLRVFSPLACCGALVLLLFASRLRRWGSSPALLRGAALAVLASLCVFEAAGCGGGGASASPQVVPTPRVIGTPQGTSIITLTPTVTTSTGTPLPGIPPVQLTLTVQ